MKLWSVVGDLVSGGERERVTEVACTARTSPTRTDTCMHTRVLTDRVTASRTTIRCDPPIDVPEADRHIGTPHSVSDMIPPGRPAAANPPARLGACQLSSPLPRSSPITPLHSHHHHHPPLTRTLLISPPRSLYIYTPKATRRSITPIHTLP